MGEASSCWCGQPLKDPIECLACRREPTHAPPSFACARSTAALSPAASSFRKHASATDELFRFAHLSKQFCNSFLRAFIVATRSTKNAKTTDLSQKQDENMTLKSLSLSLCSHKDNEADYYNTQIKQGLCRRVESGRLTHEREGCHVHRDEILMPERCVEKIRPWLNPDDVVVGPVRSTRVDTLLVRCQDKEKTATNMDKLNNQNKRLSKHTHNTNTHTIRFLRTTTTSPAQQTSLRLR